MKRKIVLRLDEAIPFEALLWAQYNSLPAGRRQEYLRGLIRLGLEFQNEPRAPRGQPAAGQPETKPAAAPVVEKSGKALVGMFGG